MTNDSILIRKSDQKQFHVTFLSHWSEIESQDGETDWVKWIGSDEYVSRFKGHGYLVKNI